MIWGFRPARQPAAPDLSTASFPVCSPRPCRRPVLTFDPVARLFLVDGMSHAYRAYHAIQGLTNRRGLSTNAVYGFTVMLRKLIQDEEPEYLAVAFDPRGPTIRHEQFKDYKANRARMPADLAEQLPFIRRLCDALDVPTITLEGYEADDVIGTLTRKAREKGLDVVIVSIDKDLLQLVDERVSVLDTRNNTLFTPDKVEEKWGVRPDQIVDVLSLIGDTSDNIPGAPGIGDKGARSLIAEYGTLDNLLENHEKVSRKSYRESLAANADQIRQSRELLRVYSELPVELDQDRFRVGEPDSRALRELFEEMEFSSFLEDLPGDTPVLEPKVQRVRSAAELERIAERARDAVLGIAVWYEGDSPLDGEIQGLALYPGTGPTHFVGAELTRESRSTIRSILTRAAQLRLHDLKLFLLAGRRASWNVDLPKSVDTMLMAYLLEPNQRDFSLEKIASDYLGLNLKSQAIGSLLQNEKPVDLCRQAMAVYRLTDELLPRVRENQLEKLLSEAELPLVAVLADMEWVGVRIDSRLLESQSAELEAEIAGLTREIHEAAGEEFNLNSPRQLAYILFEKLHLPSSRKTGKAGHLSTGVEVLEELAGSFEIVQRILDYRELAKLKGTYVDALPKLVNPQTGRIHASFNQMVASTGRLSSSNPNLQNIPIRGEEGRRIRKAFVADEGHLILSADYSQIELRVMAHLSEDPVLVGAFQSGEDIHERTAREVFGEASGLSRQEQRRRAKVINFGIMYGLSAYGLARSLKIDRAEAQQFIDDYFNRYKGVQNWIDRTLEEAEETGMVKTMFGRIRQVPEIRSKNRNIREFARRTAINAPIQGSAADLIKVAMVAIHRRLNSESWQSRLIMQVHDELVFEAEVNEAERLAALVTDEMEGVIEMKVPLKVDLAMGPSWFDAK